jgi:hypothetical protein
MAWPACAANDPPEKEHPPHVDAMADPDLKLLSFLKKLHYIEHF